MTTRFPSRESWKTFNGKRYRLQSRAPTTAIPPSRKSANAIALLEEEATNRELIEKSRPLMTQKFFEDLLAYSGSSAEETLLEYTNYLQIPTNYHYYNVLKVEITNCTDIETHYGIVRYQMDVLRMMEYVRQYGSMFDWTYSFYRYSEIICCIGQNTHATEHFLTVIRKFADSIFSASGQLLIDVNIGIGVSNAYLSALYKKITGVNIGDTISEKRISHACQLLRDTDLPLKDICLQCGFSNQYYFSSCFKKKMGCSPSQYRTDSESSHHTPQTEASLLPRRSVP